MRFEDLRVWQLARLVTAEIYKVTNQDAFKRDYGLKDQIRRASVSIVSNIAEGNERKSQKEQLQFLNIAKGSAGEVRAQLYVSLDCGYLSDDEFQKLYDEVDHISRQLYKLIESINNN